MKHHARPPYPFRMATMMAPSRIMRTMRPPAQIPRISPISSECCDTSRGRLLSLQAAARGQGQAGGCCEHPPRRTPGGLATSDMKIWDSSHGMNTHYSTKVLQGSAVPHYDRGQVPLLSSSGVRQTLCTPFYTFHHTPQKTIHPWMEHPAPTTPARHLHHSNSIKKENSTKGKTPDAKESGVGLE